MRFFLKFFILNWLLFFAGQGMTQQIDPVSSLTLEEKIGQLFIVPACQLRGDDHLEDLKKLIKEGKVGGIILKQGTAEGQWILIDKLQKLSHVPLLCVQDGEWGVGMRLRDVHAFPRNLTLGAVQDLSLLFQLGQEIGRQCRLVGVHLNLAPVSDVNCNPLNPIIHMRSFGEDPVQVTIRSKCIMTGMQSMGVLACAKHFPGHGDTSIDSHADLPVISHDWNRLQKVELFPFQELIQAGVKVVMSAHLSLKAIAEEPLLPSTFSKKIITDLLQKRLGFKGLVISDALNMQALSKHYSPDQIAIKTFLAGHDLLLYGDHIAPNVDHILRQCIPQAFGALKEAIKKQEIPEALIDEKVRKILKVKAELGLYKKSSDERIENLAEKINSPEAYALKRKLFQEAITVVRNEEQLLPLKEKKVALIEWGESPQFANKIEADRLSLNDPDLFEKVKAYSSLIVALSQCSTVLPDCGIGEKEKFLFYTLSKCGIPTVAVIFGTPYALSNLPLFEAMVVAYENQNEAQEAAADVLLGQLSPKGRLPVSVGPHFPVGAGLNYKEIQGSLLNAAMNQLGDSFYSRVLTF